MPRNVYDALLRMYCIGQHHAMRLKDKLRDEKGATTVEYALLIAVVVIGIIAAATAMFEPLEKFFKGVVEKVSKTAGVE